jgi:hypothetical protein
LTVFRIAIVEHTGDHAAAYITKQNDSERKNSCKKEIFQARKVFISKHHIVQQKGKGRQKDRCDETFFF